MAYPNGRDLRVYDNDSNQTLIAGSRSLTIDTDCEVLEVNSANSGEFRDYVAGRKDWSFSVGYLVLTFKSDMLKVGTTYIVKFKLGDTVMTGRAICNKCSISAQVGSLIKGTFNFKGSGPLQ